jgi:hypothetical protein
MGAAWLTDALALGNAFAEAFGLEGTVTHEAWIGQDSAGDPIYDAPRERKAMIQEGPFPVRRLPTGDVMEARVGMVFTEEIPPNGAEGRREPIDPRDKFTLRYGQLDALELHMVEIPGSVTNPATELPFQNSAWFK